MLLNSADKTNTKRQRRIQREKGRNRLPCLKGKIKQTWQILDTTRFRKRVCSDSTIAIKSITCLHVIKLQLRLCSTIVSPKLDTRHYKISREKKIPFSIDVSSLMTSCYTGSKAVFHMLLDQRFFNRYWFSLNPSLIADDRPFASE